MATRRGSITLLVFLLLGQLVLLSAQAPDRVQGERTALARFALRTTAPVLRAVHGAGSLLLSIRLALEDRAGLRHQNRLLAEELDRLRRERIGRLNAEWELRRLREALDLMPPRPGEVRLADVVRVDHGSYSRHLVVRLVGGEGPPLADDSPVTTHEGLVGRVVQSAGAYARVQLLTDRAASVGVMIGRTRRQGVVRGGEGGRLILDYVPIQDDVRVGDRVLTAGIDGIYPRGETVGTVVEVAPGDELFHSILVAPAVDFGLLDQVYVLEPVEIPDQVDRERDGGEGAS